MIARHRMPKLVAVCVTALVLPAASSAAAQESSVILTPEGPKKIDRKTKTAEPARQGPEVFQLTIDPAAEPVPPLKHTFRPAYNQLQPGNSVPFYYRALMALKDVQRRQKKNELYEGENWRRWMEAPLSQIPQKEMQDYIRRFDRVFRELEAAVYREHTDWGWRIQDMEGLDAITFLIGEIQDSRELARLLAVKVRLAIAAGDYEEVIRYFRIGYKLAGDVAEPPIVINDLVGVAIATILNQELINLIDAPNSPNLYWALASLPEPLIDIGHSVRYEVTLPERVFPLLKDPLNEKYSAEEWTRRLIRAFRDVHSSVFRSDSEYGNIEEEPNWKARFDAAGLIIAGYPRARRKLIEAGYDAERLDRMPVAQVVAVHDARLYRLAADEMLKWSFVPYHQSSDDRANQKMKEARLQEVMRIGTSVLPAIQAARAAEARLQTKFAALKALEAIRMHLAASGGKLPRSLDEITVVPVPLNPATAKPFPYRLEGEKAVLEIPAVPPHYERTGWRLEITVNGKTNSLRRGD